MAVDTIVEIRFPSDQERALVKSLFNGKITFGADGSTALTVGQLRNLEGPLLKGAVALGNNHRDRKIVATAVKIISRIEMELSYEPGFGPTVEEVVDIDKGLTAEGFSEMLARHDTTLLLDDLSPDKLVVEIDFLLRGIEPSPDSDFSAFITGGTVAEYLSADLDESLLAQRSMLCLRAGICRQISALREDISSPTNPIFGDTAYMLETDIYPAFASVALAAYGAQSSGQSPPGRAL